MNLLEVSVQNFITENDEISLDQILSLIEVITRSIPNLTSAIILKLIRWANIINPLEMIPEFKCFSKTTDIAPYAFVDYNISPNLRFLENFNRIFKISIGLTKITKSSTLLVNVY